MLVNCDESPEEVDRILKLRQVANDAPQKASGKPQAEPEEPASHEDPEDVNAALEAALGAAGGIPDPEAEPDDEPAPAPAKAPKTQPAKASAPVTKGGAASLKNMSTEAFLSQFEDPEASAGAK